MKKHLGPIALAAGLVGIISGGVWAGAHAFAPVAPKPAQVQFVQPAAQVVTPTVTTTATATVAPKPVAPKPVQSVKAKAPAVVAPIQRQAAVSDPTPTDPTPTPESNVGTVVTNPDGSTSVSIKPGQAPPPLPAHPAPSPSSP